MPWHCVFRGRDELHSGFERLAAFLDHAAEQHFLTAAYRARLIIERVPDDMLDRLAASRLPNASQWLDGKG